MFGLNVTSLVIAGATALIILGGAYMKGRDDGADRREAVWQERVAKAEQARDEERRRAAEVLSMQALEFAKQEAVLRQRARETANALEDALAANSAAISACAIPGELFDAIFGPATPGGTSPNPG